MDYPVPECAAAKITTNVVLPGPLTTVRESAGYRWRIVITTVSLLLGIAFTGLNRPLTLSSPLNGQLETIGWAMFFAGAALRLWASTYICARKTREIVRTGPYSICRNPLYWGTLLMVGAFPLFLKSPVLAASMLPPLVLYLYAVVPAEEWVMSRRHGEGYAVYCMEVSRWLPNFARYDRGEPLDRQTIGFYRECQRMVWWLVLAVGLELLFHFANQSWWWHPLHWW